MNVPAIVFQGLELISLGRIEMEDPGEGAVQIRTSYSTISAGTEGWVLKNRFTWSPTPYPCVPGYQRTGVITKLGPGVTGWKVGDPVMATIGTWQGAIRPFWGAHVAVANTSVDELFRIPDTVSHREASAAVVAQVGYNAAYRANLMVGDWVLVMGDGLVGQFAAQAARSRGCRVVLSGHRPERIALAAAHSADAAIAGGEHLTARVREIVGAQHVAAVLDSVQGGAVQDQYLDLLENGRGQIVYCGFSPANTWADMAGLQRRELTTHFVAGWTRSRMEATLRLLGEGKMSVAPLVTHGVSFSQAAPMYRMVLDKSAPFLGIVIDWAE